MIDLLTELANLPTIKDRERRIISSKFYTSPDQTYEPDVVYFSGVAERWSYLRIDAMRGGELGQIALAELARFEERLATPPGQLDFGITNPGVEEN